MCGEIGSFGWWLLWGIVAVVLTVDLVDESICERPASIWKWAIWAVLTVSVLIRAWASVLAA